MKRRILPRPMSETSMIPQRSPLQAASRLEVQEVRKEKRPDGIIVTVPRPVVLLKMKSKTLNI